MAELNSTKIYGRLDVTENAVVNGSLGVGVTPTYKLDVDGNVRFTDTLNFTRSLSASNKIIDLQQGYSIYSDNTGTGNSNSRLWIDTPDEGEVVIGPRASTLRLDVLRLRSNLLWLDGGNVAVGKSSANEQLEVEGFVRSSLGYKINTTTVIDNSRNLFTNEITTDGNVGIGTTPSTPIDLQYSEISTYSSTDAGEKGLCVYNCNNAGTNNKYSSIFMGVTSNNGMQNARGSISLVQPTTNLHNSFLTFKVRPASGDYCETLRLCSDGTTVMDRVRITGGGTPDAGCVLTAIDGNGNACWCTPTGGGVEARIPETSNTGTVCYNGITSAEGRFWGGATNPTSTHTARLNYGGEFRANILQVGNLGFTSTDTPLVVYGNGSDCTQGVAMFHGFSTTHSLFLEYGATESTDYVLGVRGNNDADATDNNFHLKNRGGGTLFIGGEAATRCTPVVFNSDIQYKTDSDFIHSFCANNTSLNSGRNIEICGQNTVKSSISVGGAVRICGGCGGNSGTNCGGDVCIDGGIACTTSTSFSCGGNVCIIGGDTCNDSSGGQTAGAVRICGGNTNGGFGVREGGAVNIFTGLGQTNCGGAFNLFVGGALRLRGCRDSTASIVLYQGSPTATWRLCTTTYGIQVNNCGCAIDWIATSDCRLKTNIQPISNALSMVTQLCGVCYEMCDDEKHENRVGLVAQEVEKVIPEVVSIGEPSEDDEKYGIEDVKYGLKYDKLTAVLVEAIKEQQEQIEELKNQINILKTNKND